MRARRLLIVVAMIAAAAPPSRAAGQAPPSPSPSPSPTAEDRAREVEREDLGEDAPPPLDEPLPSPVPARSPSPAPPAFPAAPSPEPSPFAVPPPEPPSGVSFPSGASFPQPAVPSGASYPKPAPRTPPSPTPPPESEPAPAPTPAPAASPESGEKPDADAPTVLDKIGSFQDIEDLDLGDLLSVRSGEGGARTADDEPGSVYVVTEDDIRRSGARGLVDLLETVPGLEVVTDNLGRGRVLVRGVPGGFTSGASENLLVMLNGVKLNENVTGGALAVNLDLPVDNIKRIEVVRGPGTVFFGAGAYLGTINIVTESVDTFRRDELTLGGGSFKSFLYNFRYGTTVRQVSLAGFLQYSYTGGAHLDVPRDLQTSTDAALATLGIAPASRAPGQTDDDRKAADANIALAWRDFGLNIRVKKEDAGGYIGILDVLGEQNRLTNTQLSLAGTWGRSLRIGEATGRVAFSQSELSRFLDVLPPGFTLVPASRVQVRFPGGVAFQDDLGTRRVGLEGTLAHAVNERHTLTGGVRLEHESTFGLEAKSNFDFETAAPLPAYMSLPALVPEAGRTVLSLYGQDAWNPTGRVGVTAGLRLDRYTDFGTAASPRLAAVFRARPDLNLKASYGRAVRVPSFLERLYSSPRTSADPRLEPARLHSLDLGAVWRRRDLRLSATVYRTALRDLIAPLGSGFTVGAPAPIANVAGIDAQGLELEASRSFSGNRMVQAWLAFQHPEDVATGVRLADVPSRLFRVTGLLPAGEYLLISPSLAWHGGRPRAEGDPRGDLDGYTLVDVVVRARNFHPRLELAGSIQNLFDVRYADPSPLGGLPDDYPRPGRAAFLKVKYRF